LNVKVKGRKGGYRGPVGTDDALWVQKPCGYTGPQNLLMLEVLGIGLHMLIFWWWPQKWHNRWYTRFGNWFTVHNKV